MAFKLWLSRFNSRTPGGVRRICISKIFLNLSFNSRTPGGVRLLVRVFSVPASVVSIHAPREGCDYRFNPFRLLAYQFQFTHPGRGATSADKRQYRSYNSFNSRTPGGVRPLLTYHQYYKVSVSIHAPREGCDLG